MLEIIVLAAGMSRRMGAENKLLLSFQGKTILEKTLDNIIAADLGNITIVVGHELALVKPVLKNYPPLSIIENFDFAQGMTSSIKAGIKASSKFNTRYPKTDFMICLSDMPLISADEYQFLKQQFYLFQVQDAQAIVLPFYKNERGNPVIFSNFYEKSLLNLSDTEGAKSILKAHSNHVYKVEMPTDAVLRDTDTPEDYQYLLSSMPNKAQ